MKTSIRIFILIISFYFNGYPQNNQFIINENDSYFVSSNGVSQPISPQNLNGIWKNTKINVCWENPLSENERERKWVEDAISSTWESNSLLDFYGWNKCNKGQEGIHILIDNKSRPSTKKLGSYLDGLDSGMILNFNWANQLKSKYGSKEQVVKMVAIHEFGHALGFAHQNSRDDCNFDCTDLSDKGNDKQKQNAYWHFKLCDANSVMNYCNENPYNGGFLSDLDIKALNILYGTPNHLKSKYLSIVYNVIPTGIKLHQKDKLNAYKKTVNTINNKTLSPNQNPQIQVQQGFKKLYDGQWYLVKFYLHGDKEQLLKIKEVEYTLHRTFDDKYLPFYSSSKISNNFQADIYVWGSFNLVANVKYHDIKEPQILTAFIMEDYKKTKTRNRMPSKDNILNLNH